MIISTSKVKLATIPARAAMVATTTMKALAPCWEEQVTYEPINMDYMDAGLLGTTVADVQACQQLCADTLGCYHFSFWTPGKQCHLEDILALRQMNRIGFISGPFQCLDDIERKQDYFRVGNTILPYSLRCL